MLKNYEAVNEYLSDDSKCSDIDKIDNAEFPSIAYWDFVEIVSVMLTLTMNFWYN